MFILLENSYVIYYHGLWEYCGCIWTPRPITTNCNIKNKKEISNLFDDTDYLISCSKVETFGITIAESIAKGVPAIVLNSGGPNDFINKSNSYSVTSFNHLKSKIKNIINKPKKFNRKIMRSFIYNRFSEKILIKKLRLYLRETMAYMMQSIKELRLQKEILSQFYMQMISILVNMYYHA